MQKTRRSGYTMAAVLFYSHFFGNFLWVHLGHTASEAHHLIFGPYVINECCDIICDITALHVHQSHDLYYKRSTNASVGGSGLWLSHLLEVQRTRLNVPAGDLQRGMWMNWLWYESVHLGLFQTEIIEGWVKPLL